jgi:hypothetical protein
VDEDLVEDRPALAAQFDREWTTVEARLDRPSADLPPGRRVEAAGALEGDLERLEDLDREPARPLAKLELGRRQ